MNLTSICHTEESVTRLEPLYREMAKALALEFVSHTDFVPFSCKQTIWKVMAKKRISVPAELFENMTKEDSLEMWAVPRDGAEQMRFVLAIGNILGYSSYTLEDLSTQPWNELFRRDSSESMNIVESIKAALTTGKSQYEVTSWHEVVELKSDKKHRFLVQVSQITPYRAPHGAEGIFALVKTRPTFVPNLSFEPAPLRVVDSRPPSSEN